MNAQEFVSGLVAEMQALFSRLAEGQTLEAESQGHVDVVPLLRAALKSELEAAELGAFALPTTPEIDAKSAFAQQCADEMKHYRLIAARPQASAGLQPEPFGGVATWALPNPSGLNAHYSLQELARAYRELARALESAR